MRVLALILTIAFVGCVVEIPFCGDAKTPVFNFGYWNGS